MVLSTTLRKPMLISESKYLLETVTTLGKPRKYTNEPFTSVQPPKMIDFLCPDRTEVVTK